MCRMDKVKFLKFHFECFVLFIIIIIIVIIIIIIIIIPLDTLFPLKGVLLCH